MTERKRVIHPKDPYGEMNIVVVPEDPDISVLASRLSRKVGETPGGRFILNHVPRLNDASPDGHPQRNGVALEPIATHDPTERERFDRTVEKTPGKRPIVIYTAKPR